MQPVSMGSAGLNSRPTHGGVDEIWQTFCDLAMAAVRQQRRTARARVSRGHRGEPAAIRCGRRRDLPRIWMAADLPAQADTHPAGCACNATAHDGGLVDAGDRDGERRRALERVMLFLPAAPHFRIEKEIRT